MIELYGYKRSDGRTGIRNHILILPASVCASDTTGMIAAQVQGAVSFHNQVGCSQVPSDMRYAMDMMAGFAANPNVYGTIVVGLGCETCQVELIEEEIKKRTNKPLETLVIQKEGGTIRLIEKAVRMAQQMAAEASMQQKVPVSIKDIILATECGGSDPTSGLAANPVMGSLSDRLVSEGSTVILSETPEFIGAEMILASRAKDERVRKRILDIVDRYEKHFIRNGENIRLGNPTPGNVKGGLTTLEEKSLGCIHKGGSTVINEVYDYGKQISSDTHGLVVMDTPGNDASSIAGMLAGGAQVVVFSSGLGSPLGSANAPVIKITGNADTYRNMEDNIDFDASRLLSGEKNMAELEDELYRLMIDTCNGRKTKAEILGFTETAVMRSCNYV